MTGKRVIGWLPAAAALISWQILATTGALTYQFLPPPTEIARTFAGLVASGELVSDVLYTASVAASAASIAVVLGGVVGLAVGAVPRVRTYAMASVDVVRTVPAVALMPVALLALGPATSTELLLAAWAASWPVVLSTAGGVAAIPGRLVDVSRMLHHSRPRYLITIMIPAVVPAWLVGARTAVIIALHVCLIGEILVTSTGLGGALVTSLQALAPARLWAYALTCGALGLLLNVTLRRLTRLWLPGSALLAGRPR